jgi:putative nucleotidyltransferase with HDIG domain
MKVLFVDDETMVLEGLQRGLFGLRDRWSMTFVPSARAALLELARAPFDVLVTDMMMPEMNGAELILHVRDAYPELVRIVLSGYSEFETTLRAVPVAHHYLLKPCTEEVLEDALERAYALRGMLGRGKTLTAGIAVGKLPPAPQIYTRLVEALCNAKTSVAEAAGIIEQDPVLAAKVVALANSAGLRTKVEIANVRHAAVHLGTNMLKNIVLGAEAFGELERGAACCKALEEVRRHGILVGSLACRLIDDKGAKEDAYLAGLLHDIGWLHMALRDEKKYELAKRLTRSQSVSAVDAEERLFGCTHAEIGAWILNEWGLSYPVIEAVAHHHRPAAARSRTMNALFAVHLASELVREQECGSFEPETLRLLQERGVAGRLERWRETAAAMVAQQTIS